MMRNAAEHPKFYNLKARLRLPDHFGPVPLPRFMLIGALEALWLFTARYAPQGNVGKWSNADLARAIEWPGDPDALIGALIDARWLDVLEGPDRLYVHDWHEHADDAVHMSLARAGLYFANGAFPRLRRFSEKAREKVAERFAEKAEERARGVRTPWPRRAHGVATKSAPPEPEPRQSQSPARKEPAATLDPSSASAASAPPADAVASPPKPRRAKRQPSPDAVALTTRFIRYMAAIYPEARPPQPSTRAAWEMEIDRMLRLDVRSRADVEAAIDWLQGPNLERGEFAHVVQCPATLRGKYAGIMAARQRLGDSPSRPTSGRAQVAGLSDWEAYEQAATAPRGETAQ